MSSGQNGGGDYYVILGVAPTATAEEITRAYYLLARRYHPDTRANSSATAAKFKQINEAYEVLSDEHKRRSYDRQSVGVAQATSPSQTTVDLERARKQRSHFQRPTPPCFNTAPDPLDIVVELPIRPEEARSGGPCDFTLSIARECERCAGQGQLAEQSCGVCRGEGWVSERRKMQVRLPAGLRAGSMLRIAGQGQRSRSAVGDLLVRIKIVPYC